MSEEDTRKMLEEQLEQRGNPAPQAEDLAPSSKVMRIVSPEEIKEVQKKNLLPSQPPEAEQSIPKESR
jgi:hypothetical protein